MSHVIPTAIVCVRKVFVIRSIFLRMPCELGTLYFKELINSYDHIVRAISGAPLGTPSILSNKMYSVQQNFIFPNRTALCLNRIDSVRQNSILSTEFNSVDRIQFCRQNSILSRCQCIPLGVCKLCRGVILLQLL